VELRDVLEHTERAEETAERNERFGRRAVILVSVLAALLAIASLAGNRASNEAILAQAMATDTYNEYQANSLKRHVNLDDAALLRLLAAGGPNEIEANQQAAALEQAVADKYQPAQDELLPRAQGLEQDREAAEARHRVFQVGEAGFQLGIVLSSVAIVARAAPLLWAAGVLGVFGTLLTLDGFTLAVRLLG